MSADKLLSRLDGVHQVGHGRWRARCPAHDGKNRDVLSVGETADGTVLLKCFHGCTAAEVVAAVCLELHDLFPPSEWITSGVHHARPRRPRVDWPAAILAVERDLLLCKIVLHKVSTQQAIADDDAAACQAAATRVYGLIQEARNG